MLRYTNKPHYNKFIFSDYYDMKLKRFSQNEFLDKMIKSNQYRIKHYL